MSTLMVFALRSAALPQAAGEWKRLQVKVTNLKGKHSLDFWKVDFANETDGWLLTKDEVLRTNNGGKNWAMWRFPKNFTPFGAFFLNSRTGWIVGGGEVRGSKSVKVSAMGYRTDDGGESWKALPAMKGFDLSSLRGVHFVDENAGWAVGEIRKSNGEEGGAIFATEDGGKTWDLRHFSGTDVFVSVDFVQPAEGWVLGQKSLMYTNDGGKNWTARYFEENDLHSDLAVIDGNTIRIAGVSGQKVLSSNDAGRTWRDGGLLPEHQRIFFSGVEFLNESRGWLIGGFGGSPAILTTRDGGRSWNPERVPEASGYLRDLTAVSDRIFAAGDKNTLLMRQVVR